MLLSVPAYLLGVQIIKTLNLDAPTAKARQCLSQVHSVLKVADVLV